MIRRRDVCAGVGALAGGVAWFAAAPVRAQGGVPRLGTHYLRLGRPAPVDTPPGQIEVLEFFWYNCPHCSAFDPLLAAWIKRLPMDVVVRRTPIAFQDTYVPQQKLYFALEAMGLLDALHERVFAAIHKERLRLVTPESMADWLGQQGVDRAAFTGHFNSFTTAARVRRATQLMSAYEVAGVPALGVAGRYYTDGSLAGSLERSLLVADHLIAEVRAGR